MFRKIVFAISFSGFSVRFGGGRRFSMILRIHRSVRSQSCPGLVSVLSQSCPSLVPVLSQSCPSLVPVLSQSCPSLVPVLSRSCPSLVTGEQALRGLKARWRRRGIKYRFPEASVMTGGPPRTADLRHFRVFKRRYYSSVGRVFWRAPYSCATLYAGL